MAHFSPPTRSSPTALAAMQFVAGGCAGLVEVSMMHPLDLIKTRFQIQRGPDDPQRYTSLWDCFRKITKTEGPSAFYKGILPPLLAETPKRAVKFFTFERYKSLFSNGNALPAPVVLTLAGLSSGLTEAVIINPFEVVKVQMQAERNSTFFQQRSTFVIAREIIHENGFGFRGLNKGLTSTLGRNGVFNMIYFSFYYNMRNIFPDSQDLLSRFIIGVLAGVLGSCVNIPFDVAKSRIQGPQPVSGQIKYRKCFQTILLVYREEGYLALYKGLLPKVLRLGPGGAVMLLVYETAFDWMKRHL